MCFILEFIMARDPLPPPPPEPSMAQVPRLLMEDREAARTERNANLATLHHLAQIAVNQNGGQGNEELRSKLRDFQNTNPPVFSKSEVPLDADDWIRTIENNLRVAQVGDNEKVVYATHYPSGPARAWWEAVRAMLPQDEVVAWEAFKTKFLKRYVPSGLVSIMREKFLQLKQGGMSVSEYLEKFTTLARYAPADTDTMDKKKERFMNKLHDEMQCILVVMPFTDLESLADAAIMMEHKRKDSFENRKRRQQMQQGGRSSSPAGSYPRPRPSPLSRPASQPPRPTYPLSRPSSFAPRPR